nr:DUF2505 family protein [Modestobacter sp. DSM 44400]
MRPPPPGSRRRSPDSSGATCRWSTARRGPRTRTVTTAPTSTCTPRSAGRRPTSAVHDDSRPCRGHRSTATGDAEVDAPLIGRQVEAAVRELVGVVLRRESEVLARRPAAPA